MTLSKLPLAVSASAGLVVALVAATGAQGRDVHIATTSFPRDVTNPKDDNVFQYLSPQLTHQALIGIIYISFWLGATGWDIVSTMTFDLRVVRETRYKSFFSVVNSLAYLISRYFTFIWLLRSLLDAISAIDDCHSHYEVSAVLYGFVVVSTYIVFALRTANVWQMKPVIVIPLFAVVAGICGTSVALGHDMQVTRIGTSPFCSYILRGVPSYVLLCLCGFFDLLNFTFLGLKLSKSGFKGMVRCMLPQNRPNYDHAEIRQMLLQRTGVFTLVQLGLLTSIAVLYAVFPDQQATYKLMQVGAFHSITSNMNASIFRKAWRLTREQSPANINVPPAYQSSWPNSPGLGITPGGPSAGYDMSSASSVRRFSREKAMAQKAQDWSTAYVEGELVTDNVDKEKTSLGLPTHQGDTTLGAGLDDNRRSASEGEGHGTDGIRFDTVLSQTSRGGALGEPRNGIATEAINPRGPLSRLPSHHNPDSVQSPRRPSSGTTKTMTIDRSEAGPQTRPGSSSTSLVTRALGRSGPGRELRVSTSDGLGASSKSGKEVDLRGIRPHTTPSPRVVFGPVQVLTPSPGSPRNIARLQQEGPLLPPLSAALAQLLEPATQGSHRGDSFDVAGRSASGVVDQVSPRSGQLERDQDSGDAPHRPAVTASASLKAGSPMPPELAGIARNVNVDGNAGRAAPGTTSPISPSRPKTAGQAPVRSPTALSRPSTAPGQDHRYSGLDTANRFAASTATGSWRRQPFSLAPPSTAFPDLQRAFADTIQSDELRMEIGGSSTDDGRPRTSRGGPVAPFGSREPGGSGTWYSRRPSLPIIPSREPPTDVELLAAAARAASAQGPLSPTENRILTAQMVRQPSSAIEEAYRELEEVAGRPSLSASSEASASTTTTLSSNLNASHHTQS
ncbi:hypothetical protein BCV69DRAFT_299999 [Microstroma glucosiphilum]|uniref:Uncharacterized protein n=1 Tax=Pseudomicrostroma glucosiphilum TaxID=1684307 RepID=A0A316U2Z2_9BASI|nr:hypothetical protein BCV69DRAFT_299999 [Pseudomicrostroma glucosiphilum]PWN19689.1 hypothetical protein BCV69DRAFT_299999 [Pseudomicrostroma glucosiphilum]